MTDNDWRAEMKVHPAADLFPMMSDAELDELARDIAEHGLRQIYVTLDGQLLDGRNRLAAMHRIPDRRRRDFLLDFASPGVPLRPDTDAYAYVISANVHRRHLTAEQKREIIAKVLRDRPGDSDRAIGKLVQADHKTVAAVRSDLVGTGEIPQLDQRIGVDGKARQQPGAALPHRPRRELDLTESVSLERWHGLDAATRESLLRPDPQIVEIGHFNKQDGPAIEWAQWSWNPITGCLHDCPYCYARDIAERFAGTANFPNGFAPTLRPRALLTPRNMRVPDEAATDTRFRNVFTGSMADIFGRWVPQEWIEAVLAAISGAPEWNFLCLTKFPKRMAEFEIPANAWMGTTVDLQARVAAAEAAFAHVGAKVKWLSCEPMLEPLRFKHLDRFDWIVIGGASRTAATPDWHPPFAWVADLVAQARDAGLRVYFKTNLLSKDTPRLLELPFDAPITPDRGAAPEVFHYLSRDAGPASAVDGTWR